MDRGHLIIEFNKTGLTEEYYEEWLEDKVIMFVTNEKECITALVNRNKELEEEVIRLNRVIKGFGKD